MQKSSSSKPWLGRSGTAVIKDWEVASNMAMRAKRVKERRNMRSSSMTSLRSPAMTMQGPFVRGPVFDDVDFTGNQKSAKWHQAQVDMVFNQLDSPGVGLVTEEQLKGSFPEMGITMDGFTFSKYSKYLTPLEDGGVDYNQFHDFHKNVWRNQPKALRRFAGDPEAEPNEPVPSFLKTSSSSPSVLMDVSSNEQMARKAFRRHCKPGSNVLDLALAAEAFRDLGLDPGPHKMSAFLRDHSETDDLSAPQTLTFHQFVSLLNEFLISLEKERQPIPEYTGPMWPRSPDAGAAKMMFSKEAARGALSASLGLADDDEDDEDDEDAQKKQAIKEKAKSGIIGALFG